MIYLDYQATTPLEPRALEAMMPFLSQINGNPHATHSLGIKSALAAESAKEQVAHLINALPDEILFTSGATEANNHALFGVMANNQGHKKTILVSDIEHMCVTEAASFYAKKFGYSIKAVRVNSFGQIDLDDYKKKLNEEVLLVSFIAVNNEIGVIQDIKVLAEMAGEVGAYFHTDAAQAPEALKIDVLDWGVDLLSLSAHKIYGPSGIGALYVSPSIQANFSPLLHGGGQQNGFRAGTLPVALCVGFGKAAEITLNEHDYNLRHLKKLKKTFILELENKKIAFKLNGDQNNCHPGNINIQLLDIDNAELFLQRIQTQISASTGSACNSGLISESHVLRAIGLNQAEAKNSLRISIGRTTTMEEIPRTCAILNSNIKLSFSSTPVYKVD